jgi:hypothetical protein
VTRIDLTTRELHALIQPVLPHASTSADDPHLSVVHLQTRDQVLYAIATDRLTLGAARHPLEEFAEDFDITLDRNDLAVALRLFTFTKDEDPKLSLLIDKHPRPVGRDRIINALGLRIDGEDGTRLILHDCSFIDQKPFAAWRELVGKVLHRATLPATPAVLLAPALLPRWAKAAGKGERLTVFVGPEQGDPVLFVVENHFIGVWKPTSHLDGDDAMFLFGNAWRNELPAVSSTAGADS